MKYTCLILLWSLFATMALPADNLIPVSYTHLNTTGGIAGSLARTVLDTAPYEIPADDTTLQTEMDAKTTVYSWRDDYDDITAVSYTHLILF